MQFSDEELIAYLLGDASRELSERIQRQLSIEPELLGRLSEFRILLEQMDSLGSAFEPPANLVDGTLTRIDALADGPQDMQPVELSSSEPARSAESSVSQPVLLSPRADTNPRRSSIWDSTALTISLTILCCLALPALVRVRFESRKAQCARNLSVTGSELINYALNHPGQRFPHVALEGPEAFAGVYAIYLHEAGGPIRPAQLQCASLIGTDRYQASRMSSPELAGSIPTFAELHQFAVRELAQLQRTIGGDYAYNLGVAEQGSIRAPKCEGRSQFAILADAPVIIPSPEESAGSEFSEELIAHEGKGINIFYEDGRVVFVTTACLVGSAPVGSSLANSRLADNPLHNQRGVHEVGLHPQDASLAPSHFPPLGK